VAFEVEVAFEVAVEVAFDLDVPRLGRCRLCGAENGSEMKHV
jgi:hypothetical protein